MTRPGLHSSRARCRSEASPQRDEVGLCPRAVHLRNAQTWLAPRFTASLQMTPRVCGRRTALALHRVPRDVEPLDFKVRGGCAAREFGCSWRSSNRGRDGHLLMRLDSADLLREHSEAGTLKEMARWPDVLTGAKHTEDTPQRLRSIRAPTPRDPNEMWQSSFTQYRLTRPDAPAPMRNLVLPGRSLNVWCGSSLHRLSSGAALIDCSGASPRCRDRGYVVDLTNRERRACCPSSRPANHSSAHEANCAGRRIMGAWRSPPREPRRSAPSRCRGRGCRCSRDGDECGRVGDASFRSGRPRLGRVVMPLPSWPNACIGPSSRPSPTAAMRRGHPRVATSTG